MLGSPGGGDRRQPGAEQPVSLQDGVGLLTPLPAASPHKDCGEPGQNHGLTDGSSDLPEALNAETSLCAPEPQW